MKKRIYLFLFLLPAVLILGGCGKQVEVNKISTTTQNNAVTETQKSDTTKMSATAKEMMKSGKSLDCTFVFTDEKQGVTQSGKFYVDGPQARFRSEVEITATFDGKKSRAYSISSGNDVYTWNDAKEKTGFKINMNEAKPSNADQNAPRTEDLDQKINFDCRPWTVDNAKFTLPAGVEFTDFGAMMKSLKVPTSATKGSACSICNQIPDARIKAECQKNNCK